MSTHVCGVALDEVRAGGTGLYAFTTDAGVPVRLHDMDLVRLELDPSARRLVLEFRYDDPQWTPPEARATPVAVFVFDGIEVVDRQDDDAGPGTPPEAQRLVSGFDHHEDVDLFALSAGTTYLVFRAAALSVSMRGR